MVTSEEAGFDKPHRAPFELALRKMRATASCVWMIGDNPVNDIGGAREKINAVTLQKLHPGIELGKGANTPDAAFREFGELRQFLSQLSRLPQRQHSQTAAAAGLIK